MHWCWGEWWLAFLSNPSYEIRTSPALHHTGAQWRSTPDDAQSAAHLLPRSLALGLAAFPLLPQIFTASATPFAAAGAALVYTASFDAVGFHPSLALIHHTLVGDLVAFPEPVAVGDRTHMTEDVVYR